MRILIAAGLALGYLAGVAVVLAACLGVLFVMIEVLHPALSLSLCGAFVWALITFALLEAE